MKTKDCVNYLVQHYPETKASEWKRRSKKRLPDGTICRTFEHIKSGITRDVLERPETTCPNNQPKSTQHNPNSKYVYAIDTNPNNLEPDLEDGPEALLIIGTRQDWETRGCSSDYENPETLDLLATLNMHPETEATWFIEKGKTQTVINLLSSNPDYDNDAGFQKFIDECN